MTIRRAAAATAALLILSVRAGAADLAEIEQRGTLRVIVWTGNLPALYDVKGPSGLDHDLLLGFAQLRRLRLEVVSVSTSDERLTALLKGRGDVIGGGLVETPARRERVAFSTEVFPVRHVVITRKPHGVPRTLEELRQERVGTVRGTSWAEEVKAAGLPPGQVDDSFASADDMMEALRGRRISAVVLSVVWAIPEIRKDPELQMGLFVGGHTKVGFGLRKEDTVLRQALDDHLTKVRRTESWSRLVVKYFGENGLEILRRSREP